MLYELIDPLRELFSAFNVLRYITFRAAYAVVTALLLSALFGPWMIARLRRQRLEQVIREEGPSAHLDKRGTPTMGGLLILVSVIVPTLLWANLASGRVWIMIGVTFGLGMLGFLDDYLRVVRRVRKGLLGRYKIVGQVLIGAGVGIFLILTEAYGSMTTQTTIPFLKDRFLELGLLYVPFVVLVITASSNAVNLADGLDGLAIGMVIPPAIAFGGIAYLSGNAIFARYLNIPYIEGCGELAVYTGALFGACLGFLWFNAHPAEVFMGDTGSLALGGSLGALAILVKRELLLVIVGGLFVLEVLSVVIQVLSVRWTGRRVFRMAPLHHHFELSGWEETRVVVRFWIVSILLALVTLSTLKLQ
ncbi:MAG: phospho-N-acetylmuramoyl-pentapeptide-transferase [Candidatus Eisenbacteria bacterium]|nr:phospho-N-acetylmuramoyl-pentapeptide-transferase [Candidatus Latescibacterota bacterium]MBD3302892.1 phospho-N-acetylmuramoyl-pentapeptide-transferase [Candidatus Eisenbacteria bacterium]